MACPLAYEGKKVFQQNKIKKKLIKKEKIVKNNKDYKFYYKN
ncbi:hypothetical protein GCM10008914_24380 [Clostridium tertium]